MNGIDVSRRWDDAIGAWICEGIRTSEILPAWYRAYTGVGDAAPVPDALPEPWFGNRTNPAIVFLALNPGQAFLGSQRWHQRHQVPDLQSRHGLFVQQILSAGAHSRWATHFPDWTEWAGPAGNGFYEARFRFARDWLSAPDLNGDDCLLLELYPWHSTRFISGAFRPGREAVDLLSSLVIDPLEHLPPGTQVFAFGSPYFPVLPRIGFAEAHRWSVDAGDRLGEVKDRAVSIFKRGSCSIVVEKHSGGAGPPKSDDVPALRDRVLKAH